MTYAELYRRVCDKLTAAGCDSPDFDAACLLTDIGGMSRGVPGVDFGNINAEAEAAVWAAAEERAAARPLQYILGQWDFLSLTLSVGEGVLIPRPDTECLCEAAAEWLNKTAAPGARVLDLCAGTGCVGLGVASLCRVPLQVTAVELSDAAWEYLEQNIARYPMYDVTAQKADVLADGAQFTGSYTAILSNPPYIPSGDLPSLQREVQREPQMALDGDADGLRFYRAIAAEWVPKLEPGGLCAVEVGIGQAEDVAALFREVGLEDIQIQNDLGGIPRVVMGIKKAIGG